MQEEEVGIKTRHTIPRREQKKTKRGGNPDEISWTKRTKTGQGRKRKESGLLFSLPLILSSHANLFSSAFFFICLPLCFPFLTLLLDSFLVSETLQFVLVSRILLEVY